MCWCKTVICQSVSLSAQMFWVVAALPLGRWWLWQETLLFIHCLHIFLCITCFLIQVLTLHRPTLVWVYWCLRHMERCFSDETDVQEECRIRCTYGRAIDISQGTLTCPSYTDAEQPFLFGDSDTPPHLIAFYDTLGIRRTYSRLKPPASSRGKFSTVIRIEIFSCQNINTWNLTADGR